MNEYVILGLQIFGTYFFGVMSFPFVWNVMKPLWAPNGADATDDDAIGIGLLWPVLFAVGTLALLFYIMPKRIAARSGAAGLRVREKITKTRDRYITGQRQQEEKP